MKKLCNGKVKRVHPSPSSSPCDFLAALPAALLALAAALSPEEKEVLVYLLSPEEQKTHQLLHCHRKSHQPALGCGCFCCYKSFWAIWNESPNNHLIHRILDAVESGKIQSCGRRRGRRGGRRKDSGEEISPAGFSADAEASNQADADGDDEGSVGEEGDGKSSVSRFVSFIGERVWGVWNC